LSSEKYVYTFGEGDTKNKQLLGGKGANLGEMTKLGLPIPPGFTISTEVCDYYIKNNKVYPDEMNTQVEENVVKLEETMGMKFGDVNNPLLVSVRSGAAISMPGMMDTVLNLGLNDQTINGLIAKMNNERFAWDAYRRLITMFGDVVMGVKREHFEHALQKVKEKKGWKYDTEVDVKALKDLVKEYKQIVKKHAGKEFPQDIKVQLQMAIDAVFGSWDNPRAISYRRINNIKGLLGTAVNVQTMVFGNMGDDSATGVAFTRNPSTGENKFYGEFLYNAQGEDVVAGTRTPRSIDELDKKMPEIYKQLLDIREILENHYKDMQDVEFTIQQGKLYMLQTRTGKRTGVADVKIAVDMVKEKLITKEQALMRIEASKLVQLLHKRLDPAVKSANTANAKGLPASPGAAVGKVVFTAEEATEWKERGEDVVLVRLETSPEDIEGMNAAEGFLTARGGMTSHAAVVARGMGKCCVAGCQDLIIDEKKKTARIGGTEVKEGDYLTLDGTTGEVYIGQLNVIDPEMTGDFGILMGWAQGVKRLGVLANADTPHDAAVARNFGAEGIGLCRTEHMFFEPERINSMREMILADDEEARRKALTKLLPYQREDFIGILRGMDGLPVIVRLLDPPLHEFLPKEDKEITKLSGIIKVPVEKIKERIQQLHEFNPMLGFRGCRVGIVYPEVSEMQATAIFQAALQLKNEGLNPMPMIEVPNIISIEEYRFIRDIIKKAAKDTGAEGQVTYHIGSMIEFPRAALTADILAKEVEFMSFGTNDLTQTTLGFSRDDVGKFINRYLEMGIFNKDPFQSIDKPGVGEMMRITVEKARSVKPDMDIGICGEHGGDPESVKFCHQIGLSNVSSSPFRVPIAILAAAQAKLKA
jgi:pyruvate,orthophosphate dikinase